MAKKAVPLEIGTYLINRECTKVRLIVERESTGRRLYTYEPAARYIGYRLTRKGWKLDADFYMLVGANPRNWRHCTEATLKTWAAGVAPDEIVAAIKAAGLPTE